MSSQKTQTISESIEKLYYSKYKFDFFNSRIKKSWIELFTYLQGKLGQQYKKNDSHMSNITKYYITDLLVSAVMPNYEDYTHVDNNMKSLIDIFGRKKIYDAYHILDLVATLNSPQILEQKYLSIPAFYTQKSKMQRVQQQQRSPTSQIKKKTQNLIPSQFIDRKGFLETKEYINYKGHLGQINSILVYLANMFPHVRFLSEIQYFSNTNQLVVPPDIFTDLQQTKSDQYVIIPIGINEKSEKSEKREQKLSQKEFTKGKEKKILDLEMYEKLKLPGFSPQEMINMWKWEHFLGSYEEYKEYVRNANKKTYVVDPIGHQNVLILNPKNKHIYRFEPHGWSTNLYDNDQFDVKLRKTFKNSKWKPFVQQYVRPFLFCPKYGPQVLENYHETHSKKLDTKKFTEKIEDAGGLCAIWSILFTHAVISNPQMNIEDVVKGLMTSPKELYEFVRSYTNFFEKKIIKKQKVPQKYVKNAYTALNYLSDQSSSSSRYSMRKADIFRSTVAEIIDALHSF